MAMNRLHDIQNVYEERELRAKISALACPGLLIDSDGAIMLSDWVEKTYICAVIYSTPSLYYVNKFHDDVAFDDEKMKSLGALLSLSSKKTDGKAVCVSDGCWKLLHNNCVTAQCFDGRTVFVYDGENRFYVFSWDDGKILIPTYDYKFCDLPENCKINNEMLEIDVKSGKVYELHVR